MTTDFNGPEYHNVDGDPIVEWIEGWFDTLADSPSVFAYTPVPRTYFMDLDLDEVDQYNRFMILVSITHGLN